MLWEQWGTWYSLGSKYPILSAVVFVMKYFGLPVRVLTGASGLDCISEPYLQFILQH
jgi:hypothetical protein